MFVEVKIVGINNVRLGHLFHDTNKILNSDIRTYGKHCGDIVVSNENNENNNIAAIEMIHHRRSIAVLIV